MALDRSACRLDDKDVGAAHVFLDLHANLAIGKLPHLCGPKLAPQALADLLRQRSIGIPGKYFEAVWLQLALRLCGGHSSSTM